MAKELRIPATVGPFTFAYPHLTSPDTEGKFADDKYKADGLGDPTSDAMKKAKAIVTAAAKEFGLPKGAILPLKAEMEKDKKNPTSKKKVPTGQHLFRAKSKFAPALVDANGKEIPAKVLKNLKIGAGSTGLFEGFFTKYEITERNGDVTEGMNFTLQAVQLISIVKGGGQSSFGAYEGGGYYIDDEEDLDDGDEIQNDDSAEDSTSDDGGLDI